MGAKVSNNISKVHNRFAVQNLCILLGQVSTKVVKRIVKFEILFNWQIFSSAWHCQQSSWNPNSSIVCPSSVHLWHRLALKLLHGFLSNFSFGFPFSFLKKKLFFIFLRILFFFVNMGSNGSENFKTLLLLQMAAKSFETCPEFSSQWSSQNQVWDFFKFSVSEF